MYVCRQSRSATALLFLLLALPACTKPTDVATTEIPPSVDTAAAPRAEIALQLDFVCKKACLCGQSPDSARGDTEANAKAGEQYDRCLWGKKTDERAPSSEPNYVDFFQCLCAGNPAPAGEPPLTASQLRGRFRNDSCRCLVEMKAN